MSATLTLRRGQDEYQLCRHLDDCDSPGSASALPLDDPTTALYFLREFISDSGKQHDLRLWLLSDNSSFDMNAVDDDGLLAYAAKMIASGQLVVAGSDEGGGASDTESASEGILRQGSSQSVLRSAVATTPLQHEMASQQSASPDEAEVVEETPAETTWIELELLDPNGNPVPGEQYKITMPDGSVQYGRLDGEGKARVEKLQPGSCQVTFPNRDQEVWNVG